MRHISRIARLHRDATREREMSDLMLDGAALFRFNSYGNHTYALSPFDSCLNRDDSRFAFRQTAIFSWSWVSLFRHVVCEARYNRTQIDTIRSQFINIYIYIYLLCTHSPVLYRYKIHFMYVYNTDTLNLQNVTVRASSDSRFRCFVRHDRLIPCRCAVSPCVLSLYINLLR